MSVDQESTIQNPTTAIAAVKLVLGSAGTPRLAMQGSSMLPLMREPMVLELAPVAQRIAVGDVVVFEREEKLVAHRVTGLRKGVLETCGDAQPWSPEYPALHALVGKVKAIFEDGRPDAARVDTKIFRARGRFYARTREARALLFRAGTRLRRIIRALPWRRERSYPALLDSMTAVMVGDRVRFERSLSQVSAGALCGIARRHRCAGTLVGALGTFQTVGASADYLRRTLQPLVRNDVMLALALREQVGSIAATLASCDVPFALLKGAARSYRDEPDFVLHPSIDIDILVPAAKLDDAVDVFHARGYDEREYTTMRQWFKTRHHHAAPLFPPGPGFGIELHTLLARPGLLSTPLDWESLRSYMVPVQGPAGAVLCLDAVGAALHLAVHSLGLKRLRDSVLLAHSLVRMSEREKQMLQGIVAAERVDPTRLEGSFALAASIAGIPWPQSQKTKRYLAWVARREDIPQYFSRGELIEDWYIAGCRLRPFAQRLRNPRPWRAHSFRQIVGRGLGALAYALAMKKGAAQR